MAEKNLNGAVWGDLTLFINDGHGGVVRPVVRALYFPDTGLAITRPFEKSTGWVITHVNTGMTITKSVFRSLPTAIKMLKFAASLTDYTAPSDVVRAEMSRGGFVTLVEEFSKHKWQGK